MDMSIKDLVGFKICMKVERPKGYAVVESLVLFSEYQDSTSDDNIWVELHMGIKDTARKESIIAFSKAGNINDHEALNALAKELAEEYSDEIADGILDLLPDPSTINANECDIIDITEWRQ